MLTNSKTTLNIFILLMVVAIAGMATGQIYVDASATGTNAGSSWADAYLSLQDALTAAAGGGTILVAEGTYKPDQGGGQTPSDRYATFQLISGVAIYGGFPYGGCAWEDRDPVGYETILSGDLNADDVQVDLSDLLDESTLGENSYHVVTAIDTDNTVTLDGFTIIGGNANHDPDNQGWNSGSEYARGGGMYLLYANPNLSNLYFKENHALKGGGAMYCTHASPMITGCAFRNNKAAANGGGIWCIYSSSPTILNCTISGNSAGYGGGMKLDIDCLPIIINCEINGNYAYYGAGLYMQSDCHAAITNCTISGNSGGNGSGIRCRQGSAPVITNTIFEGNTGSQAIYEEDIDSDPTVAYCLFHNNPNGDYYDDDTTSTYTGAEAVNTNVAEASNNIDGDPMFVEPGYWDGSVWVDGDYHLLGDSLCIDAGDNSAVPALVVTDLDGNPRFDDCPDIPDTGNGMAPIVDIGAYEVIAPVIQVAIDIKPGSYPNAINLGSYGLVPVAILSSDEFDATTVDPESVELAGAGVSVRGKSNKYMAHQEDINEDGLLDLMVQVATENLEPDSFQDGSAILTGNLLEEFGGTLIEGTDEITIVPKE